MEEDEEICTTTTRITEGGCPSDIEERREEEFCTSGRNQNRLSFSLNDSNPAIKFIRNDLPPPLKRIQITLRI